MSDDKIEPITVYKGYVHRVELDSVKLGFAKGYVDRRSLSALSVALNGKMNTATLLPPPTPLSGCCRVSSPI